MNITKHFTMNEVVFSQTATRRGIDNSVPPELMENVRRQAELMEKVRYELNRPIYITSWYRCPALNAALSNSSKQSAHMKGLACDFVSPFGSPFEICNALIGKIEFDQLIDEGTWVHIGLAEGPLRNEILTARFPNGKVVYSHGLTDL